MVNIGSTSTGGRVMSVKADLAKILLTSPACTEIGEKVALSRRIDKHWVRMLHLFLRNRPLVSHVTSLTCSLLAVSAL